MNNPHAFPGPFHGSDEGMTLRDYFVGQAIMGILASTTKQRTPGAIHWDVEIKMAYRIADGILAERNKTE